MAAAGLHHHSVRRLVDVGLPHNQEGYRQGNGAGNTRLDIALFPVKIASTHSCNKRIKSSTTG